MKRTPLLAFFACISPVMAAPAQEILGLQLQRDEFFTQCISNGPSPDTARGYAVAAWVIGSSGESVLSGTVTARDRTWTLSNDSGGLRFRAELTNSAPGGTYTFSVRTAFEGIKTHAVSLPSSSRKLAAPKVRNFEAAQSINANEPFTLEWEPLKGSGSRDQLELRILDSEGNERFSAELNIGATSYTIPAGTIPANSTNAAFLHFFHLLGAKPPQSGKPYVVTVESRTTYFPLTARNPAGIIEFASNQLVANETNSSIRIPLQRTSSSGTVTVDYYVEPRTAVPDINYVPVTGTAIFPPGITNAEVTVPLLNDGIVSPPRLGRLWLTNATGGATLPARRWAQWTALDSESPPVRHVDAVVLVKATFFRQTNETPATRAIVCSPHRFYVSVQPAFPGGVTSAELRAGRHSRAISESYKWLLEYNEDFPTRAALDKTFRAGAYTVTVNTLDGETVPITFRMLREPLFPAPRISNWTAAQDIDSTAAFALEWEPFEGATTNDAVSVIIRDSANNVVFETPEILEDGLLPGTTTQVALPPGLLAPGETYRTVIIFSKVPRIDIDAATGMRTAVAYLHAAGTEITTRRTTDVPSTLTEKGCCGAGVRTTREKPFQFRF